MTRTLDAINHLLKLWNQERRATRERFVEARRDTPLAQRVEQGQAIDRLSIDEIDAAPGGRTLLWLSTPMALDALRVGPGTPVRLWWDDPDGPNAVRATVARRRRDRLGVMIDAVGTIDAGDHGLPDRLEEGEFKLDRDDPGATFERGAKALALFRDAPARSAQGELRAVLFGERPPALLPKADRRPFVPLDADLNEPQRRAVQRALDAADLALVHGPPGTGKTRTLVEIIRQAVARGDKVLAAAASNAATDNLAERLIDAGVDLLRLGHPARVSPAVEARTLDALLEATDAFKLTRKWIAEAAALRRRANNRFDRGSIDQRDRRDLLREAGRLQADARKHLQGAQAALMARHPVICATAAGADAALIGRETFDLVVIDEATQSADPTTLVAAARALRLILAGDPRQLPPTVIDLDAARQGLAETFFERLEAAEAAAGADPALRAVVMLTVQHRMHADIMAFPSASMYRDALIAAPHVAAHALDDLGVAPDPLRPSPLIFIDTSGKGWDELRQDDMSTHNPEQARRTLAEALRLLGRGLPLPNLAIITPYRAQARLIRDLLARALGHSPSLTQGRTLPDSSGAGDDGRDSVGDAISDAVGTIDSFQGREREAIILDLVRSNEGRELGFLKDTRRMNVALTRARRSLIVIGDSATLGAHPYYADFLEAVELYGQWISAWADEAPPFE